MVEKIGNITLDLEYYPGEDLYSDGDIEDEVVNIAKKYPESAFPEVIAESKSWPIMYHLSPYRHNIIDWLPIKKTDKVLEIGSGCGAITGSLAARAASVTCVDLSKKRSLVNAYRNQKYDNITIMLGNFEDIEPHLDKDYDYVLLIGVFEYGNAYINSKTPYETFLSIINKHRKDTGKIAIAIENKFGLKYWAGCREDHLGTYFSGLEDYQEGGSARTFTKNGLEEIIRHVGIEQYSFYYPYPDYKFMTTIYSDEQMPCVGELNNNLRNYDRNRMLLFDEKAVFDTIIKEKEFPLFSNSYFVLIGEPTDIVLSKFSNDRADEYAIRTDIIKDAMGRKWVDKVAVTDKALEHIAHMKKMYSLLSERFSSGEFVIAPYKEIDNGLRFSYMEGISLEQILDECIEKNQPEQFRKYINQFMDKIQVGDSTKVSNYDLAFSNIIIKNDVWQMIDYEWAYDREIPAKEIAFRAFYDYLLGSEKRRAYEEGLIKEILKLNDVDKAALIIKEKEFQKVVTGNRASMGDMRELIGNVAPDMKILEEVFVSDYHKYAVQLYEDFGEGFSEANSRIIYNCFEARKDVHLETTISAEIKNLRIDPVSFPCVVYVKRISINGNLITSDKCNINGHKGSENMWVFDTSDPNITIKTEDLLQGRTGKLELEFEVVEMSKEMTNNLLNMKKKKSIFSFLGDIK